MNNNTMICKLCGHEWMPRTDRAPVACPKCKRYDWNKEKRDKPQTIEESMKQNHDWPFEK